MSSSDDEELLSPDDPVLRSPSPKPIVSRRIIVNKNQKPRTGIVPQDSTKIHPMFVKKDDAKKPTPTNVAKPPSTSTKAAVASREMKKEEDEEEDEEDEEEEKNEDEEEDEDGDAEEDEKNEKEPKKFFPREKDAMFPTSSPEAAANNKTSIKQLSDDEINKQGMKIYSALRYYIKSQTKLDSNYLPRSKEFFRSRSDYGTYYLTDSNAAVVISRYLSRPSTLSITVRWIKSRGGNFVKQLSDNIAGSNGSAERARLLNFLLSHKEIPTIVNKIKGKVYNDRIVLLMDLSPEAGRA